MSKLLIDEPPLQVLPSLATAIGLNEAIVIQQIHYWIKLKQGKIHDGERWIYNSYPKWKEQFPFWSVATIQRTFTSAEAQGVLLKRQDKGFNRQKWYRIDYIKLESTIISKCDDAVTQNDIVRPSQNDMVLTETTETTTETTNRDSTRQSRENNLYPIAESLAYVCKMDLSLNRGVLFKEAKLLSVAGATPELIKQHYNGDSNAFWNKVDWRGQKGQRPRPANVRETWGQWNTVGQVVGSGNKGYDFIVNMLRESEINNGES